MRIARIHDEQPYFVDEWADVRGDRQVLCAAKAQKREGGSPCVDPPSVSQSSLGYLMRMR